MKRFALLALALLTLACTGRDANGRIHASGHVEATEVTLAAEVGGRLLEAPFQEGDQIATGAVVARLDTATAEHELARTRAEVAAADARLSLLLSGSRVEDLRRAQEQLAQSQAELDSANRDVARLEPLARRGTATEKAADDARTRAEVAGRRVDAAKADLDKLVAGPRRQEIEASRAQLAAAEATVAAIDQRISDATVTAPLDGVITVRIAEPGEVLPPGAPIAVLTDLARPWLSVWVDEPSLARIKLGDKVELRLDGVAQPMTGTVTFVSKVAEFTPKNVQTPEERAKLVFKVKITLDNSSGVFKPGMPADAYFQPATPAAGKTS